MSFCCVFFDPLFGWDCAYVCHKLRIKSKGTFPKRSINPIATGQLACNWQLTFTLQINMQSKFRFLSNYYLYFDPIFGWGCAFLCHELRIYIVYIQIYKYIVYRCVYIYIYIYMYIVYCILYICIYMSIYLHFTSGKI